MRSSRLTRSVVAVSAAAAATALGPACSDDPTGPDGNLPIVSDLTVEPIDAGRMRLTWSHIEDVSGYTIERRPELTGEFGHLTDIDASDDSAVTYVDRDIEPLTFYGYRVRTQGRLGSVSRPSDIAGARSLALPGIEVSVTLEAPDPSTADKDGFRIRVVGPEDAAEPVAAGDTVLLSPLTPGDYELRLEGVAATCSVEGGASRSVTVTNQAPETITVVALAVRCRDSSKGGIVVEVSVEGDTTDADGVDVRVVGGVDDAVFIVDHLDPEPGTTFTTQNTDMLDLEPAEYEVQLRGVDASACSLEGSPDRLVDVIAPQNDTTRFALTCATNRPPSADAGGPYTGKANTPVQFSSEGSSDPDGSIASYTWDFGDSGAPGDGETPTHAYEAEGRYTVVLTVTDDRGGIDTDSADVTVGPPNQQPIASVTGPSSGEVGAQLAFDAGESSDPDGEIAAFAWSFGDGTTDDGEMARNTFTTSGSYTVSVTVTDNEGATASDSMVVAIIDSPNEPPTADAGGPYTGVQGQTVDFDGGKSRDADGRIARYEWQFGDGSTGSGKTVSHTYDKAGAYTVVLAVWDNHGTISFDLESVTIEADPDANQPPIAQANGPRNGTVNKAVLFNAGGSFDPDGPIMSYAWDFGDGTGGSRVTTSHVYKQPGQYTVRLTVADDQGLTGRDSIHVTIAAAINRPPIANANGPYGGPTNTPISFSSAGSDDPDGDIVSFRWDFGDGATAMGETRTHAYTGAGTYRLVLTVTDNLDAIDADTTQVEVKSAPSNAPPTAEAGGPYESMVGTPITLDGMGSSDFDGTIESFDWDFDSDGVFDDASGENPEFNCSEEGSFPIALQVTDDDDATGTDATTVDCTAEPENFPPTADAGGPYEGVVDMPITLDGSGSSDPDGTIVSFAWDFGDGESGTGDMPMHTYAAPGTYTAGLTVTDDAGETATDSVEVTVTSGGPGGPTGEKATVRGRWADENGAQITETTVGSTIFLEIDVEMEGNSNIDAWQAQLDQDNLLLTPTTQGEDLNCSNPGGQATCPSGAPPAGNTDVMDQYTGNNNVQGFPGAVQWLTFSVSSSGMGIQGLGRLQYVADQAGTVTPELTIIVAVGDGQTTNLTENPEDIVVNIPPLVINQ